jgi:hypothetical protein
MRRTRSHLLSEDMEGSYQEMMEILDEGPGTKVASEVMPDGISQPNLMDYALEQKGIRWNDKGMEQCPFLLPYILADLLYDLDLRVFPGGGSMIELGRVSLNDFLTCVAGIDSHIAARVQLHYDNLGTSLPQGYAKDYRSTIDRTRDSALGHQRFGLFGHLWRIIKTWFFTTMRLRQGEERRMCAHDCRRLSAPQAIRRDCRKSHAARSANSQSSDDDD